MKFSGYSETPLKHKLGIKEGFIMRLIHQPDYYFGLLEDLPENIKIEKDTKTKKDFIHYFAREAAQLKRDILLLRNEIKENGMIWVSWPKKTSKIKTDMDEEVIRHLALTHGLVDVKVCAIDETWSGLKLVIPVKDRK